MSWKFLEDLEKEISEIKKRNLKVEQEKAWEISKERKVLVLISTYIIMSVVMLLLKFDKPFLNALIPTLWYFLSTLSINFFKKIYLNKHFKNN